MSKEILDKICRADICRLYYIFGCGNIIITGKLKFNEATREYSMKEEGCVGLRFTEENVKRAEHPAGTIWEVILRDVDKYKIEVL